MLLTLMTERTLSTVNLHTGRPLFILVTMSSILSYVYFVIACDENRLKARQRGGGGRRGEQAREFSYTSNNQKASTQTNNSAAGKLVHVDT